MSVMQDCNTRADWFLFAKGEASRGRGPGFLARDRRPPQGLVPAPAHTAVGRVLGLRFPVQAYRAEPAPSCPADLFRQKLRSLFPPSAHPRERPNLPWSLPRGFA